MRVNIGPYTDWVGPYQLAKMLGHLGFNRHIVDVVGETLADSWVNTVCRKIDDMKSRKVKVHIDNYDVWSLDATLSLIALPMLLKLQEAKHGAPHVELDDVPEYLHPSAAEMAAYKAEGTCDANFFKRWEWVLAEMIFAHKSNTFDWTEQFSSGEVDIGFEELPNGMYAMVDGPNNTYVTDFDARAQYQQRINNGFLLFGKYYQSLWD